jgi:hypothetical protein
MMTQPVVQQKGVHVTNLQTTINNSANQDSAEPMEDESVQISDVSNDKYL